MSRSSRRLSRIILAVVAIALMCGHVVVAEDPAASGATKEAKPTEKEAAENKGATPAKGQENLVRLDKEHQIWLEKKKKWVVIDGQICFREGQLELFACPKGTKEHEAVISLNTKAYLVHAGLLACGAKKGTPVRWDPKYAPATGQVIDVFVLWTDKEGKRHRVKAQEFVKHVPTGKAMTHDWVFAGSSFWVDEDSGEKHYQAEAGDLICLSNFSTATMDLPIKSSQDNSTLLFVANTEKIPPLRTKVRVVLVPRPAKKADDKTKPAKETSAK